MDPAKPLRHAMHIDVSVAREHRAARLEAAIAAGDRVDDAAGRPLTDDPASVAVMYAVP